MYCAAAGEPTCYAAAVRRTPAIGIALAAASLRLTAPAAIGQPSGPLQRLFQGELSRIPPKAGIFVKRLRTGEQAAVPADERFNSASAINIPAMVMASQMAATRAVCVDTGCG